MDSAQLQVHQAKPSCLRQGPVAAKVAAKGAGGKSASQYRRVKKPILKCNYGFHGRQFLVAPKTLTLPHCARASFHQNKLWCIPFSEQFCESKAFEIEGGENLSVAVRIEFRAMSFNALPFPVISFVLCPRSSAPNRLRRKKVPRSPRSSAEASRLEVGLASVHVSVDASKPFTFFAHCYFAPRGLRQHDSCDKSLWFRQGVSLWVAQHFV